MKNRITSVVSITFFALFCFSLLTGDAEGREKYDPIGFRIDTGDTREGGGGGGFTAQDYTLDGTVRADLNEAPNPPTGPGIPGVNMLFEWDMGVGHQQCRDLGWECCDGVLQSNLEEFSATTLAGGSFSRTALTPTHTYCITLSHPDFITRTYYWDAQGTSGSTTFLIQQPSQNPSFTAPPLAQTSSSAPVGLPMDLRFKAADANIDRVTVTVLGTVPPGTSVTNITNPGNAPTQEAEIKISGTPTTVGNYPLTIRAQDAWGNFVTRPYTIQVGGATLFLDVTASHLPADPNRTTGADFGDIDGDGDSDLVIAHPPSASFGNRILINNHPSNPGAGKFKEDTAGRLPVIPNDWPFYTNGYRSFGIRLVNQVPGTRPDLFMTAVGRYLVKATPDIPPVPTPDPTYPYNEIELGRYRSPDNSFDGATGNTYIQTPSYRLKNDGTGRFPYDAGAGIRTGHDPLWGAFYSMMYAPWYMEGPFSDGGYGTDIEVAELDGILNAFYANLLLGEPLPNNFNRQTVYIPSGETHYWGSPNCTSLPCSYGVVGTRNWDTFYDSAYPMPGDPYGQYAVPQTADFEVADIDGDGDKDLFSAGFAFYGIEPMDSPTPKSYNHPPRIWLKRATTPPLERFYDAGNPQRDLRAYALTTPAVAGTLLIQKGAFSDLDGDGKQDLVITDIQSGPKVLRNTRTGAAHGDISFTLMNAIAGYTPLPVNPLPPSIVAEDGKEVVIGNVTGNSLPDILLIGNGARRVKVLRNDGNFNFTDVTTTVLPDISDDSEGGLVFDMDGDGDLDLFIYNNGQDRLYKNTTVP